MDWRDRIEVNPRILVGKPVIQGTRLAVEHILELLAHVWGGKPPRAKPRARKSLVFPSWVSGSPWRAEKVS